MRRQQEGDYSDGKKIKSKNGLLIDESGRRAGGADPPGTGKKHFPFERGRRKVKDIEHYSTRL